MYDLAAASLVRGRYSIPYAPGKRARGKLEVLVAQRFNVRTDFYSLMLCLGKQLFEEHAHITLFELLVLVYYDLEVFAQHPSEQRDRRHIP